MILLNKITVLLAVVCLGTILIRRKVKWNSDIIFTAKGNEKLDETDMKLFWCFLIFMFVSFILLYINY